MQRSRRKLGITVCFATTNKQTNTRTTSQRHSLICIIMDKMSVTMMFNLCVYMSPFVVKSLQCLLVQNALGHSSHHLVL